MSRVAREFTVADPLVIVVDDDAAVRSSLKFALEIEGFAVRVYASGEELMRAAAPSDGECFIVDQKLPGMTGLEVITALRRQRVAAPAILITSNPTRMFLKSAARSGIPVVEKPLLGNALIDCVRAVLAHPPASD